MAQAVWEMLKPDPPSLRPTYGDEDPLALKIEKIARAVYGADGVHYEAPAARALQGLEDGPYRDSRICMAKTQYSFSDKPARVGRPRGFEVKIRELRLAAGAGFVIPVSGEMMTMPGLPRVPNLERIDLDESGRPVLF